MIPDWTGRTVSYLAARMKTRLRFAAPTRHKATQVMAHRALRLRGRKKTVNEGACPIVARIAPGLAY